MTARPKDIREWVESGVEQGATHVIIACDTFDYDNYPVYVMPGTDIKEEVDKRKSGNMQTIDEVYDLSMDIEEQLSGDRAWNF